MIKPAIINLDSENLWRGGQQQAVYLYNSLLEKEHKSIFICKNKSALEKYFLDENIKHISLPLFSPYDIFSAFRIARIVKEGGFNILHCHSSHSLSIGLLVKFFNKNIKLIGVRRVDFNLRNKIKYNSPKLNRLICVSDAIRKVVINNGVNPEKCEVIYSGINLDKFSDSKNDEVRKEFNLNGSFVVGTIAAFSGHKDYPNLINAAKIVKNKLKNVVFMAVGDGALLSDMQNLIKINNLDDSFITTGFRRNIGDFIKTFDIFVMASKKEGLGTSILDAMALGKSIIGTDAGGIPEAVNNGVNGIVVGRQDPEALAEAIISLYNNTALRQSYEKNSLEEIKKFDINHTIEKNINLYNRLLNE